MAHPLILMRLVGAALVYGDGIIAPALSVLSPVEGLEVETSDDRVVEIGIVVEI